MPVGQRDGGGDGGGGGGGYYVEGKVEIFTYKWIWWK